MHRIRLEASRASVRRSGVGTARGRRGAAALCAKLPTVFLAAFLAVFLALAAPFAASAKARTVTFTVSNGQTIVVLDLTEVDTCEEVEDVQRTIQRTGYRTGSPATVTDPRDRELLNYEKEVAERYYHLCPGQRVTPERFQSFGPIPKRN